MPGPAEIAVAAALSRRAMLNIPLMAFSTDRLNAVGETGSALPMSSRTLVERRSSPCRDAKTTRTSGKSAAQSCATFSALLESELKRRRTIGSIKLISGDVDSDSLPSQQDQRATGIVQCKSGISVFAHWSIADAREKRAAAKRRSQAMRDWPASHQLYLFDDSGECPDSLVAIR
uniref:Uncharacterized protein n=1 Tax=Ralstonia solanacearum TaxID=305 RepID=A0A0S4TSZ2_RALSL|nr:protein of unknown function [Ralstonia solanacearum]